LAAEGAVFAAVATVPPAAARAMTDSEALPLRVVAIRCATPPAKAAFPLETRRAGYGSGVTSTTAPGEVCRLS